MWFWIGMIVGLVVGVGGTFLFFYVMATRDGAYEDD